MRAIIKRHKEKVIRHKKKIIVGNIALVTLLTLNFFAPGQHVSMYLESWDGLSIIVGNSVKIDVNINADIPINSAGGTITFPPDMLEIVAISKENSFFDLWTEKTAIMEEEGKIYFSGGTLEKGGHTGPGTIFTLTVKAKKAGEATLGFVDAEAYAHDGTGVDILNETHELAYSVSEIPVTPEPSHTEYNFFSSEVIEPVQDEPQPPSPDINNDGKINAVDISIMLLAIFKGYNASYDLNLDCRCPPLFFWQGGQCKPLFDIKGGD